MMGFGGYGYSGMMDGLGPVLGVLLWAIVLFDRVLVGIWLWKHIEKK